MVPSVGDDPALSSETKHFLTALNNSGGEPIESMAPIAARKVLVGAQSSVEVDTSGITETENIVIADGYSVKLNIVKPTGTVGVLPAFIFIHGGGWVLGDYPTHRRMVRDLVVLSGTVGIFVNYTPAPDKQYPTQTNEIYAVTKWIAENGSQFGIDGKNIALVGNSAGGNMATVTAIKALEHNGPEIKLQILFWPTVNSDFETSSYQRYGKERFLTTPLIKWMYDNYIPGHETRKEIYAAPLLAPIEKLRGLPPTLIQVGEADIFYDECLAYGRKLDEAGVNVTTMVYAGAIHDFGLLNPLAHTAQAKSLFLHAAAELKAYLKPVI
ncbi:alpha/beta hydrolase [Pedobacter frigiditerrae]|uniref:Alpha/beta hydrolase n=2 Tax=Pedobacter frigiditerrae TaxID=2530452 RepID=A0A4V2MI31_9SPHI|nr:alpha/beta hydrolase [Pedobacter frigiditerrae]